MLVSFCPDSCPLQEKRIMFGHVSSGFLDGILSRRLNIIFIFFDSNFFVLFYKKTVCLDGLKTINGFILTFFWVQFAFPTFSLDHHGKVPT